MRIIEAALPGVYLLEPEKSRDDRGFFARMWCADELQQMGLHGTWVQSSIAFNEHRSTLRGMHLQAEPHSEVKLVTCVSGAVFDVVVDVRPGSPTRAQWLSIKLTSEENTILYVPRGFAHGYLTLTENACVEYHMSDQYDPSAARGWRWNDPAFGITWPSEPLVISERDATFPDFTETA